MVADLGDAPACAIIKHANPCGVARGANMLEAYTRAFDCDRTSAFGGIIALNQALDGSTATAISEIFTEVVIAPGATDEAKAIFEAKKNLRLLLVDALPDPTRSGKMWKQVSGGYLVQDRDNGQLGDLKVVTKRAPSDAEMEDMQLAWKVAKHVKSNAIIYVKDGATVGVGAGQMSRVDSTRIAARKSADMAEALGLAEPLTKGSVVASDAFFPFSDGLLTAAEAGATAIIQPGGSMRDDEVIKAADDAGLAMVFTVEAMDLKNRLAIEVYPPFLNLRMAWNQGINFGIFDFGENGRWVLIVISLIIVAFVIYWAKKMGGVLIPIAAGVVVGGALGNIYDRLTYGAVADFLNMSCCGFNNPFAFNVADVAIFAGAIVLILFGDDKKQEGA